MENGTVSDFEWSYSSGRASCCCDKDCTKTEREGLFFVYLLLLVPRWPDAHSALKWILIAYKNIAETQRRTFTLCLRQMVEVEMWSEYVPRIPYLEVQRGSGGFK